MRFPNLTQGTKRSLPDGFLHLNNYAHTVKSGLAGSLFERVFTERQQEIVGCSLLEIAKGDPSLVHFKHNVWRFKKEFLNKHFQSVVFGTCRLIRKEPATLMSIKVTEEMAKVDKTIVGWPSADSQY